jgi:hypothetical protein
MKSWKSSRKEYKVKEPPKEIRDIVSFIMSQARKSRQSPFAVLQDYWLVDLYIRQSPHFKGRDYDDAVSDITEAIDYYKGEIKAGRLHKDWYMPGNNQRKTWEVQIG